MQIDLNKPIHELDIMALLIKSHKHSQACLTKHGEVLTDIVADMLNSDDLSITTEHYQFFQAYAKFKHLDAQITKPEARESSHIAKVILNCFADEMHRDWQAFQEFDANNGDMGLLDSVHEFLQEKYPEPVPPML